MGYFILKVGITALLVAIISELSKHFSLFAAALASLPLTSILAFIWIHYEGADNQKLISMSYDIFWLVLPSLAFFLIFPFLLKQNIAFIGALIMACIAMSVIYAGVFGMMRLMSH